MIFQSSLLIIMKYQLYASLYCSQTFRFAITKSTRNLSHPSFNFDEVHVSSLFWEEVGIKQFNTKKLHLYNDWYLFSHSMFGNPLAIHLMKFFNILNKFVSFHINKTIMGNSNLCRYHCWIVDTSVIVNNQKKLTWIRRVSSSKIHQQLKCC